MPEVAVNSVTEHRFLGQAVAVEGEESSTAPARPVAAPKAQMVDLPVTQVTTREEEAVVTPDISAVTEV
jgi:hypothetical protein